MYLNKNHLMKYLLQMILVSLISYCISPCKLNFNFAIIMGLLSASIFAIVDTFYPMIIYKDKK